MNENQTSVASRDGEATAEASFLTSFFATIRSPVQLPGLVVIPLLLIGASKGYIASYPAWIPITALALTQLANTAAHVRWPTPTLQRHFLIRSMSMMIPITVIVYLTGWGAAFAIGFAFGGLELIRTTDSRCTMPAVAVVIVCIALGELAVSLDLVLTMLDQPIGHGLAVFQATGTALVILAVGAEAREKESRDKALRSREEWFRALVEHSSDVVCVLGADYTNMYTSPSVGTHLGYPPDEPVFQPSVVHPDDVERALDGFLAAVSDPSKIVEAEVRLLHASGEYRTFEVSISSRLDDPDVAGVVCNLHDVTMRRDYESQLQHQALHDALTGLPNRVAFMDHLERARRIAVRDQTMLAVLFLDVDRFKFVNDSLGHDIGDRLLVEVADRLVSFVRPGDVVARFGGDEFTMLLGSVEGAEGAVAAAERITGMLRHPLAIGDRELQISSSVGIALGDKGIETATELLRRADLAMYSAKENGRSRWELYDPTKGPKLVERLELESELLHAIDNDELLVHFQPEVLLATGRIIGAEALLRWQHPRFGLLSPNEFIPLAEESNLICAIDRYVLTRACSWAQRWSTELGPTNRITVSVNLSPRFVREQFAVAEINEIVRRSGVDPRFLQVEITERTALLDIDSTLGTLHELRASGVGIAIDDFGTGYSSLGYLKQLPVDVVKLDRSFVEGMVGGESDAAIVQAVITMGHALGMRVTAEGVESEVQAERLCGLGCDTAMGWLWSAAVDPTELSKLLHSGASRD